MARVDSMASMASAYSLPESESYDMPKPGRRQRGLGLRPPSSPQAERQSGAGHRRVRRVAMLGACGAVVLHVLATVGSRGGARRWRRI
jgi:hypothetical protein